MFLQMVGAYVGSQLLDTSLGPVFELNKRQNQYGETLAKVIEEKKDIFPLDPPALINHIVAGYLAPESATRSFQMLGFSPAAWDNKFFQHTTIDLKQPESMLSYQIDEFKKPVIDGKSQLDIAAWQAQATPDLTTILTLLNRQNINKQVATNWMRRIGFRDNNTTDAVISLRNEVPPLQDLIRFAVRDSFTPQSVSHYKENREYPIILDRYIGWLGLAWPTGIIYGAGTDDQDQPTLAGEATWGDIYWASHWVEPSPTQGYEMLYRGYTFSPYGPSPFVSGERGAPDLDKVFDEDDLRKLLKSADYGPYWRKRLEMIAYHPFNLTDTKRMYRIGVMDRKDVYHSMRSNGFNDDMSEKMTEYIIRTERPAITPEVKQSFMSGIIDELTAKQFLSDGGYSQREIDFALSKWKLQLRNDLTRSQLSLIRRAALLGLIDQNASRASLNRLGIAGPRIDTYLQQWDADILIGKRLPALRLITRWYIDGIITDDDLIGRLQRLRYADTDISVILREARSRRASASAKLSAKEISDNEKQQQKLKQSLDKQRAAAAKQGKEIERANTQRAKADKARQDAIESTAKAASETIEEQLKREQEAIELVVDPIRKSSTDKNLVAWYKKGLLTEQQVFDRLLIRGFNREDADRWIITYIGGTGNG